RKDGRLSASMTLHGETRESLTPPLPSRLTFTIPLPPDPVLRFAMGVSTFGEWSIPVPVHFRLVVDGGNGPETVFHERVRLRQGNRWKPREVDLSAWAGSTIRITFRTALGPNQHRQSVRQTGRSLPIWGNPVVTSSAVQPDEPPSLILISVDSLRPDHLGVYGYHRDTSPHIDEFAAGGVIFDRAVSPSSWTLPSHMSMLTGLLPSEHRASRKSQLPRHVSYLPQLLAEADYRVNGVVTNGYLSQAYGFERGFHVYQALLGSRGDDTIDSALEIIREAHGRHQFLFLHLIDPHWPYQPPMPELERFGERPRNLKGLLEVVLHRKEPRGPQEIQRLVNLYDAEIAFVDREIGRLFAELKESGLYDRSLIILTSDHGEAFYEHKLWQHSDSLYEEMIRAPLIVKWPGRSPRKRVKQLVSLVDLVPTLLEEAGITPPTTGATSLRRYLEDVPPVSTRPHVVSEVIWDPDPDRGVVSLISLRAKDMKYIAALAEPFGDESAGAEIFREELYDLSADPGEENDLLAQNPPMLASFRRELRAYINETRKLGRFVRPGEGVTLDDETREQLRSLGYLDN
ncbi:MAG: sulfatase, partial [Vicinamibacteria bacterium]